jgi:hypothetical protein
MGAWTVAIDPRLATSDARRRRPLFRAIMAGALLLALLTAVVADANPASAGTPEPKGSLTCQITGGLAFNPPLTPTGTAGVRKEVVTATESLTGCTGTSTSPGLVPSQSSSAVTKPINIKATTVGRTKIAGSCTTIASSLAGEEVKSTINWPNGIKSTKEVLSVNALLQPDPVVDGEQGLQATGTATKSFAGDITTTSYLDPASTSALQNCVSGTTAPIGAVNFDPANSLATAGKDVLTTGSLAGKNVRAGDDLTGTLPTVEGEFSCGSGSTGVTVSRDPAAPATAVGSMTTLGFGGCSVFGNFALVSFLGLPYPVTFSDTPGLPVTISNMLAEVVIPNLGTECLYNAPTLTGSVDNTTNVITFTNTFQLYAGVGNCPQAVPITFTVSSFSDVSLAGSPVVFVN